MFLPILNRGGGGDLGFLNINPYIVVYYKKGLFTRKIITLRKGF